MLQVADIVVGVQLMWWGRNVDDDSDDDDADAEVDDGLLGQISREEDGCGAPDLLRCDRNLSRG